jgi:hypothetical protein
MAADCLVFRFRSRGKTGKIGSNWANSAGGFLLFPWSCRLGPSPKLAKQAIDETYRYRGDIRGGAGIEDRQEHEDVR